MAKKSDTGPGDPYSDAEEAAVCDALEEAMGDDYDEEEDTAPTGIQVTAEIEWAGTVDHLHDGVRTTRLDGLELRPVVDAVQQLRAAEGRDHGPLRSYQAKGWQAQLRAIGRVRRGPAAMAAAGLSPSRETMRRWAKGDQAPSKANREKISRAYDELRNPARGSVRQARHEVAEKLTDALRDRYGVNVRFRNIRNLHFE